MKTILNTIMPAVVLTVICIVVSAALFATNSATAPVIEAAKRAEADAARAVVLPGAVSFDPLEVSTDGVVEAYRETSGLGYVITASAKGYGGAMQVMVGIKDDGTIATVKLMDNSETAGLGSRAGLPAYTDQYIGKNADLSGVDTISGSTITSKAFEQAVKSAFEAYETLK